MPPELDQMNPEMEPQNTAGSMLPTGETDKEGAMAKADLYKLANYSFKLFKKIQDEDQLEAWVQAKITKAADYIASVYHYLEYEMEFSEYGAKLENSEMYSESQKAVLKNKLMEAKEKIKALKVKQADKQDKKEKKVEEGMFGGDQQACEACGGSGHVMTPARQVPEEVKAKVQKYNRQAKAFHAASKRIDKNKNGIPDDEEVGEGFDDKAKVGDTKKTRTGELTKTSTGVVHKNTSYADDGEAEQKSGKGVKSHAKSQSAAEKKDKAPAQKQSPKSAKTWGMKDSEKFDNRDGAPAKPKKEKAVDETYGQGVYEAKGKKPDFLDMDKDGDKKEPMKKAVADKKKNPFEKKVDEAAKPSAGLSAEKKSAVVKKAKAGGDIGKPGKSFDKVAKAAGGGEKGTKIAAAAMWKNVKETTAYVMEKAAEEKKAKKDYDGDGEIESGKDEHAGSVDKAIKANKEKVNESADLNRMKELMTRLNG
jgi:hypothetical protein